MKKLSILLFSFLFINTTIINAQTDAATTTITTVEEVKETKTCPKTGKICETTCENKKNGTCCQSKKSKSSCNKSKKGSFNFNKANNYGNTSSCSKTKAKKCCKKKVKQCGSDCTKKCCSKTKYEDDQGHSCSLLGAHEVECLSIPRGSLNQEERLVMAVC